MSSANRKNHTSNAVIQLNERPQSNPFSSQPNHRPSSTMKNTQVKKGMRSAHTKKSSSRSTNIHRDKLSKYRSRLSERTSISTDDENEHSIGSVPNSPSKQPSELSDASGASGEGRRAQKLTPYLFDLLDRDQSGSLSCDEILGGVANMINNRQLEVTREYQSLVKSIMSRSDVDNSGELDRKEFGKFLFHLARALNMPLDQMAERLVESSLYFDGGSDYHAPLESGEDIVSALFAKYDESGDGVISRHELSVAMRKIVSQDDDDDLHCGTSSSSKSLKSLTYPEVMEIFDQNDANGDGDLGPDEFARFVSSFSLAYGIPMAELVSILMKEADSAHDTDLALEGWKMMPQLFRIFDTDHDGSIHRKELVEHMGMLVQELGLNMTLADIWSIFDSVDSDDSHDLDRHEFGYFLSAFAKQGNVTVEEVTFYLSRLQKKGRMSISKSSRRWGDVEQLFERWDVDNDGYIDRSELFTRLSSFRKQCSLSGVEFMKIIHDVDENLDSKLDRREMSLFLSKFADRAGINLETLTQHLMKCSTTENMWIGKTIWGRFTSELAEEALATVTKVEATNSMKMIQSPRAA